MDISHELDTLAGSFEFDQLFVHLDAEYAEDVLLDGLIAARSYHGAHASESGGGDDKARVGATIE